MKLSIYVFLLPITFIFVHLAAEAIDFRLLVELLFAIFLANHLQQLIED